MSTESKNKLREEVQLLYKGRALSTYTPSVIAQLESNEHFLCAQDILAYLPFSDEIPFFDELRQTNLEKRWFVPSTKGYFFTKIESQENHWVPSSNLTLILVPARCANLEGYRLGRGGGWYDRFLQKYEIMHSIVIIPDFALVVKIPRESHDIAVKQVLVATS